MFSPYSINQGLIGRIEPGSRSDPASFGHMRDAANVLRRYLESPEMGCLPGQGESVMDRYLPWRTLGSFLGDPGHRFNGCASAFAQQPWSVFPGGGASGWSGPGFSQSQGAADFWKNCPGLTYPGLSAMGNGCAGWIDSAQRGGDPCCRDSRRFDAGDARTLFHTMRGECKQSIGVRDLFRYATCGEPEVGRAASDLLNDPARLRSLMDERSRISSDRLAREFMPFNIGMAAKAVLEDTARRGESGVTRATAERRAREGGADAGAYEILYKNWGSLDKNGQQQLLNGAATKDYRPNPDGVLSIEELRAAAGPQLAPASWNRFVAY